MKRIALAVLAVIAVGCGPAGNVCAQKTFGGPFCIPDGGVAAAGQKLSFEAVDQCVAGCGTATLTCVVTRDAGTLTIAIAGQVCEAAPNVACAAACALTKKKCELPALEEGDYTIVSANQASQTLKVRDGGVGSCAATSF